MSFLYPRKVIVKRGSTERDFGAQGYSGMDPATESEVVKNVKASIQQTTARGTPDAGVPSDAYTRTGWRIFLRLNDPALIKERDVIVDEIGKRYLVTASYWNSLGYNLYCELLEA